MPNRELYCNDTSTTLSSAVTTTGQTIFTVTSGLNFPKVGNFRILIGTEICIVTAVAFSTFTPATWTVTRAAEGTTAATYAIGTRIDFFITQQSLMNIFGDSHRTDVIANYKFTPPRKGDIFIPQNSMYTMLVYDGDKWIFLINGRAMTPPNVDNWILDSRSDANCTATIANNYLRLADPATAYGIHTLYRPAPATPYKFTVAVLAEFFVTGHASVGIGWKSNSGQYTIWGDGSYYGNWYERYYRFNAYNNYNGDYMSAQVNPIWQHGPLMWMRLSDDGTTKAILISSNGVTWIHRYDLARTDFMSPDNIALQISDANGPPLALNVVHMEIS